MVLFFSIKDGKVSQREYRIFFEIEYNILEYNTIEDNIIVSYFSDR